jgi:hypothetical protein
MAKTRVWLDARPTISLTKNGGLFVLSILHDALLQLSSAAVESMYSEVTMERKDYRVYKFIVLITISGQYFRVNFSFPFRTQQLLPKDVSYMCLGVAGLKDLTKRFSNSILKLTN